MYLGVEGGPEPDEYEAFFDAWKQLPGTGSGYTVKKYCATTPTYYLVRFPSPEKPLDDDAATRLSEDIERLETVVIPALMSKRAVVDALAR